MGLSPGMSKSCCCRSWIRCLRWEKRDRTLFSSSSITSCRQLKPMTAACTDHKKEHEHCFGVQLDCVLTLLPPSFTNNSIMALLHQPFFPMENLKIVCQISCDALEQQKRCRRARAFNLAMVIEHQGMHRHRITSGTTHAGPQCLAYGLQHYYVWHRQVGSLASNVCRRLSHLRA